MGDFDIPLTSIDTVYQGNNILDICLWEIHEISGTRFSHL